MGYKDPVRKTAYQSKWMRTRRLDWVTKNGPCKSCGSSVNLEVDHIDRFRKTDHRIWSWSEKRREAELAKCQVLCRTCHRSKTARESKAAQTQKPGNTQKLNEMEVLQIRTLLHEGLSRRKIAARFGVNASTVTAIAQGKLWAWLKVDQPQLDLLPKGAA